MIDFDDIDIWGPTLTGALRAVVSEAGFDSLLAAVTEAIEDDHDPLRGLPNREAIINATITWVRSAKIAGYHGTRLTHAEADSMRVKGLLPLKACGHRERLERALSRHKRWPEVADRLEATLRAYGPGKCAGNRENQVHLTLSRSGLIRGFNHYLTHGAEVDQHVAYELLEEEGKELLRQDGEATEIKVAVPGPNALDSGNFISPIEDVLARGEVPNLVKEFLEVWSYRLANPSFQCRTLEVDCGMVFESVVPAAWIVGMETVQVDGQ